MEHADKRCPFFSTTTLCLGFKAGSVTWKNLLLYCHENRRRLLVLEDLLRDFQFSVTDPSPIFTLMPSPTHHIYTTYVALHESAANTMLAIGMYNICLISIFHQRNLSLSE